MKIGDLIAPKPGVAPLKIVETVYHTAIVVYLNPLIIVTADGLGMWQGTRSADEFIVCGAPRPADLVVALQRIAHAYVSLHVHRRAEIRAQARLRGEGGFSDVKVSTSA
jgi:hypothetical protein